MQKSNSASEFIQGHRQLRTGWGDVQDNIIVPVGTYGYFYIYVERGHIRQHHIYPTCNKDSRILTNE